MVGEEEWYHVSYPNGSRHIYVEVPGDESARNHHTHWRAHPDWRRGKQLAGASGIVSTFDLKTDNLVSAASRMGATTGDADPWKDKRDLGTRVHAMAEALAGNRSLPHVPESDEGYVRALMRFWEAKRPEVVAYEQFVY